jgi:chromate reductase
LGCRRVGRAASGGAIATIFGYPNAHIYPKRVFLPAVYKMLNDEGEFTDEEIAGRLEKQAEGFIDFVKRVK